MAATGTIQQQDDNMPPPKVSVLMIFLDGERFMAEAVDSLRAQDFQDWELLLVDDGSTDASRDFARRLAQEDPGRFRYFEHPDHANRGTSASRNLGLRMARGEFLLRLDCDDTLESAGALGEQVALLSASAEAALVCGPCRYWYAWRGGHDVMQEWPHPSGLAPARSLLLPMISAAEAEPVSMLMRSACVRECGGWEEAIRDFGEDFILTSKLLLGYPVLVSDRSWYRYRMHPDSYSRRVRQSGEERRRQRELLDWTAAWLRSCGVDDPGLIAALNRRRRIASERPVARALERWAGALRWRAWRVRLALRSRRDKPFGRLLISPEPASLAHPEALFRALVDWRSSGTARVQLRVGSPSGPMFASGRAEGQARTEDWLMRGMCIFLQDGEAADPTSPAATLDVARAWLPIRRA